MRTAIRLVLVGLLLVPASAAAQSPRDKVQIMSVRVGFPPGPQGQAADEEVLFSNQRLMVHKPGAWTPVYITIINTGKYDADPRKDGPAEVVVEVPGCS